MLTFLVAQFHDIIQIVGIVHHISAQILYVHPDVGSLLHLQALAQLLAQQIAHLLIVDFHVADAHQEPMRTFFYYKPQ